MSKLHHLDSYQTLETLFKRDYNTEKFVVMAVLENGDFSSYISDDLSDIELVYFIQILQEQRDKLFRDN